MAVVEAIRIALFALVLVLNNNFFRCTTRRSSTRTTIYYFPFHGAIKQKAVVVGAMASNSAGGIGFLHLFLVCYFILFGTCEQLGSAHHESEYALKELKKLSDSGVYETLQLSKVISSQIQDGIFHNNMILKLELSSPFFRSGRDTETFDVIVMSHKEDGVKSFAIDEFPVMDEDAIEHFWQLKVERKKIVREESFRRLEIEALLLGDDPIFADESKRSLKRKLDKRTVADLLSDFETPALQLFRQELSSDTQKRLRSQPNAAQLLEEEQALSHLSLEELFLVTVDQKEASDFQKYRAKMLLDSSMIYLQQRFGQKQKL